MYNHITYKTCESEIYSPLCFKYVTWRVKSYFWTDGDHEAEF